MRWSRTRVAAAVAIAAVVTGPAPTPAAPSSVVGAQTSGDSLFPHQGNGGYDVTHYDLALAWTPRNTITATATLTATAPVRLSTFSLDLEGLTVTSVTVNGVAAAFSRIAAAPRFKLVVRPVTPVRGVFTTKVTYTGTPVSHTDPDGSVEGWIATSRQEGAVALNEPVGSMTWFPNNNTPSDKATFTTRITVPYRTGAGAENRVAISNGVLVSRVVHGNRRTFTWDQPRHQATYLALVGIGRYVASRSQVALRAGRTHEWSYADPRAEDARRFARSRARLSPLLRGIEKRYGRYPGSSTGLVLDVSSLGYALETQDRPYFENVIGEETLVHELAHQWFGNAVTPADWSDVWLNEGPATFVATQVRADLDGSAGTRQTYLSQWHESADDDPMWTTPAAGFTDAAQLFSSQVYTRGAIALEALRTVLGGGVFGQVMRTWLRTYGGRSASTADFVRVAESVSGHDLTAFFAEWIFGTGKPAAWPVRCDVG